MSSPRPASLPAQGKPPPPSPGSSAAQQGQQSKPKKQPSAKDQAKAAKAARRAQKVQDAPSAPTDADDPAKKGQQGQQSTAKGKNNQAKGGAQAGQGKGDGASALAHQGGGGGGQGGHGGQNGAGGQKGGNGGGGGDSASAHGGAASDTLQPFLHLDLPLPSSSLSHSAKSSTANLHPSIIRLALQYSEFKVVGANARCIAMLEAFKDIISSYTPPPQTSLTRHLPTTHLNPQIAHLIRARPLSVSMGTAIRYLKYEISLIEMEMDLDEAKQLLLSKIDSFIRDRILLASRVIEQHAVDKINDGDVILTYARSSVVEGVLLEAKRQGKEFSVVVVDSRPLYEGKHLLHSLRLASIPTTYVLLPALSLVLPRVSLCLLGTHALLSNGSMFSRAGTAMVAMMLREKGVPVVCCCETYKFSERVMLDSIVGNERATPLPLPSDLASPAAAPTTTSKPSTAAPSAPSLPTNLSPLSLLYDVSRPEDVTVVITEAGLIPVQSVPVLLRDYKPVQGRNS
ncbi:hypothetical protein JCM3775_004542 [Rhodotorula graminis]|uniref:Translation initiation factor eIF2B subunit delta n=1 Tax=Rhodotorula graminis (strain WP1) TaxID=578459 RepID=A0A194S6P2_RHOGW|nr:uncharacterized protein RHOBADRAFT_42591 [Rhodotorula graminis WP1]KPV76262.1 hypothetical protein RHOBADRAFT_42591 [Rhodotorula graminis WP1]